jgi:GMP synthase-like glutamine amidotransferase
MRIGILKTGGPPGTISKVLPTYPEMICTALGIDHTYIEYDATAGQLPAADAQNDAYLITGSEAGVYDTQPWISTLRNWLRDADCVTPIVGICFGHQLMAEAYGGQVERSRHGWVCGIQQYSVVSHEDWMDDVHTFSMLAYHRDQVVVAPDRSRVVGSNGSCAYAALSYTDRRAISYQGHPEFSLEYVGMLIDLRKKHGDIADDEACLAINSLKLPNNGFEVIEWIRRFVVESAVVEPRKPSTTDMLNIEDRRKTPLKYR